MSSAAIDSAVIDSAVIDSTAIDSAVIDSAAAAVDSAAATVDSAASANQSIYDDILQTDILNLPHLFVATISHKSTISIIGDAATLRKRNRFQGVALDCCSHFMGSIGKVGTYLSLGIWTRIW